MNQEDNGMLYMLLACNCIVIKPGGEKELEGNIGNGGGGPGEFEQDDDDSLVE